MSETDSKPTPGPWKAGRYGASYAVFDSLGKRIAYLYGECEDRSLEETACTAHLIAAAQELLEALEELMMILKDVTLPTAVEGYVRGAIAKAKGMEALNAK